MVRQLQEETDRAEQALLVTAATPEENAARLDLERRRAFGRFDAALDRAKWGPTWLSRPEIAGVVLDNLHYWNGRRFALDVFCIMSNHVHAVFAPLQDTGGAVALARIMHALKRYTAERANSLLGREGQFWQHESYDHVVRDEPELDRIRHYVLNNPITAGLVDEPEAWPYSWASWWDGKRSGRSSAVRDSERLERFAKSFNKGNAALVMPAGEVVLRPGESKSEEAEE